jgi:hypothetical protein
MIRRTLTIALVAALLAPAAAFAQQGGGAFGPLPQAQPTATPTPEPADNSNSDLGGRTTLWVIAGGLLIAFVGIGMFISRDARRSLPKDHRPSERLRDEGPHKHKREAKSRARARGRAQKAARRRNR